MSLIDKALAAVTPQPDDETRKAATESRLIPTVQHQGGIHNVRPPFDRRRRPVTSLP